MLYLVKTASIAVTSLSCHFVKLTRYTHDTNGQTFMPAFMMYQMHFYQGSTYKRKASKAERAKETPTLKDLDFLNDHPEVTCV